MKLLITYSSKTGNTEKIAIEILKTAEDCFRGGPKSSSEVAEQPQKGASFTFCRLSEAPDPQDYDVVILGFWIDKGMPNREAMDYMKTIKDKKTAFFFTLGASPESPHAGKCTTETKALLEAQGNTLIGEFACQGKIDKKLIEAFKTFPKDHPHAYSEESARRYAIAASHPDEEDLRSARKTFEKILSELAPQVIQ